MTTTGLSSASSLPGERGARPKTISSLIRQTHAICPAPGGKRRRLSIRRQCSVAVENEARHRAGGLISGEQHESVRMHDHLIWRSPCRKWRPCQLRQDARIDAESADGAVVEIGRVEVSVRVKRQVVRAVAGYKITLPLNRGYRTVVRIDVEHGHAVRGTHEQEAGRGIGNR